MATHARSDLSTGRFTTGTTAPGQERAGGMPARRGLGGGGLARRGLAGLMLAMVTVPAFGAAVASAHGDEEPVPARESVLQAIAYLVNTPQDTEMITDKITDARESTDQAGVDSGALAHAQEAVKAGNLMQARVLLEKSVGAKVDLTGLQVRHVLQVPPGLPDVTLATGADTGTVVVTDEMPGRGPLTGTDAAGITLALAFGGVGIVLAARTRPAHSMRTLRAANPARTTSEGGVS